MFIAFYSILEDSKIFTVGIYGGQRDTNNPPSPLTHTPSHYNFKGVNTTLAPHTQNLYDCLSLQNDC